MKKSILILCFLLILTSYESIFCHVALPDASKGRLGFPATRIVDASGVTTECGKDMTRYCYIYVNSVSGDGSFSFDDDVSFFRFSTENNGYGVKNAKVVKSFNIESELREEYYEITTGTLIFDDYQSWYESMNE